MRTLLFFLAGVIVGAGAWWWYFLRCGGEAIAEVEAAREQLEAVSCN